MSSDKNKEKMKIKGAVTMEQVTQYFEEILHNIKSGKLSFDHGGKHMEIATENVAEIELELEKKDGKHELSLELEWKDGLKAGKAFDLQIGPSAVNRSSSALGSDASGQACPSCGVQHDADSACCVAPPGNVEYEPHHRPEVITQAGCGVLPPHHHVDDAREVIMGPYKHDTDSSDSEQK